MSDARRRPKIHRFKVGDKVWVRDRRVRGCTVVEATVKECHFHPDRHPFYPNGEGYQLEGELWWSCYPGCRVFATKDKAKAYRVGGNDEVDSNRNINRITGR